MKQWIATLVIVLAILTQAMFAQDKKEAASKEKPAMEMAADSQEKMGPPPSLANDEWMKWMVGEWEGSTKSNMGTNKDWMKVEMALGDQFCVAHYKSYPITMEPQAMEMMGITAEQFEAMKDTPYEGMGVFTFDPKTGESIDHWFGSWRDISIGKGNREGNVETTHWDGPMGTAVRTMEKINENEMVMTFKETMGDGMVVEGKTALKRVKAMSKSQ